MLVLLADDEPMVLKIGCRLLKHLGHEVVQATDGQSALEQLQSRSDTGLAILDEGMPNLKGSEVLVELRKTQPDLPVFLSSGYALDSDDSCATELPKPYHIDTLAAAIETVAAK